MLITEVIPGISTSATSGDTVELYNTGPGPVDLSDWVLTDLDSDSIEAAPLTEGSFLPASLSAPSLGEGQFAVVVFANTEGAASAQTTNYGLLVVAPLAGVGSSFLDTGFEQLVLVNSAGTAIDSVAWSDTATTPGSPSDVQSDLSGITLPTQPGNFVLPINNASAWAAPDVVSDLATYRANTIDFTGLTNVSTYGGGILQRRSINETFDVALPDGPAQWQAFDRTEATLGDFSSPVVTGGGFRPIREAGSIAARVAGLRSNSYPDRRIITAEDTDQWVVPMLAEVVAWRALIGTALAGNWEGLYAGAAPMGYQVVEYFDIASGSTFMILQETTEPGDLGFRGWGTYIFDGSPQADQDFVLEVPHPINDSLTPDEAGLALPQLHPRVTLIAGAHRNNATTDTLCDGTQTNGDAYRISDVAHSLGPVFHATHEELESAIPDARFVQLHGFSNGSHPSLFDDVVVSNGVGVPAANSFAEILRDRIDAQAFEATTNGPLDLTTAALFGVDAFELGATNNVQGRLTNGVTGNDACTIPASMATERFIHIEQDLDVREEPQHIITALMETIAALDAPTTPTEPLTAMIVADPAPSNSRHRLWHIEFNHDVAEAFRTSHLAPAGSLNAEMYLTHRVDGPIVTVMAAPTDDTSSGTMGFMLNGPLEVPPAPVFVGPLASSLQAVEYYPPGDVNHDGEFDIADVILAANANVGLAVLP